MHMLTKTIFSVNMAQPTRGLGASPLRSPCPAPARPGAPGSGQIMAAALWPALERCGLHTLGDPELDGLCTPPWRPRRDGSVIGKDDREVLACVIGNDIAREVIPIALLTPTARGYSL